MILVRRSVKGSPVSAAEYDAVVDQVEDNKSIVDEVSYAVKNINKGAGTPFADLTEATTYAASGNFTKHPDITSPAASDLDGLYFFTNLGQYIFNSTDANGYTEDHLFGLSQSDLDPFIESGELGDNPNSLATSGQVKNGVFQIINEKIKTKTVILPLSNQGLSDYNTSTNYTLTDEGDNVIRFNKTATASEWTYFFHELISGNTWLPNHGYYIAFDTEVTTHDAGIDSNFLPSIRAKKGYTETLANATVKSTVLEGQRGNIKAELIIPSDALEDGYRLLFQPDKLSSGDVIDFKIHNVLITDLGEVGSDDYLSYNDVDGYFESYGFSELLLLDMPTAKQDLTTNEDLKLIEGWGDSLMAQNWLNFITSRMSVINGFGGKKSYYVRDRFIEDSSDKEGTQIIEIGRNNIAETANILRDIQAMVSLIPHNDFLILTTQNGGYLTELASDIGTSSRYDSILETERRLSNIFQDRFFNQRKAMIEGYDFGGVRLASSFTQPSINSNVQINVLKAHIGTSNEENGTAFLTNENANDVSKWSSESNKITIGSLDSYDVYEVVSVDSGSLMTVKLIENNSSFSPTNTVSNPIDDTATIYLEVCQKLDVFMYENDVIQSTLRSDGVHLSDVGLRLKAKLVDRKLQSINI